MSPSSPNMGHISNPYLARALLLLTKSAYFGDHWWLMITWWSLVWLFFSSWTLRKSTNKLFTKCLFRAIDYFLLLIKFKIISTLECYSCCEHSLAPPRHCAPSNKMTILTKTKIPFWQKQNDHSDKKMIILTKHSKSYSFHQIHEVLPEQGLKGDFLSSYCILYTVTT